MKRFILLGAGEAFGMREESVAFPLSNDLPLQTTGTQSFGMLHFVARDKLLLCHHCITLG